MISYRKKARLFKVKSFFAGLAVSLVGGAAGWLGLISCHPFAGLDPVLQITGAGLLSTIVLILWLASGTKIPLFAVLEKMAAAIGQSDPASQPDPPRQLGVHTGPALRQS
jgi:hypothetical protein